MREVGILIAAIVAILSAASMAEPSTQPSQDAIDYLEAAIELIEEHHYKADQADWDEIREDAARSAQSASSPEATYPIIKAILGRLGERHSYLRAPLAPKASTTQAGTKQATDSEQPLPYGHSVEGHEIGVVRLFALDMMQFGQEGAKRYETRLRGALEAIDPDARCGWIVDLRENGGGNMWPMLAGLDPLLGSAPFGYFHGKGETRIGWYRGPSGIAPSQMPTEGAPAFRLANEDAPVALLTGPGTTSSGEMAAMALMGRENVRSFGQPTGGYSTANRVFPLSDGALLVLTTMRAGDRTGVVADGAIPPDTVTPLGDAEAAAVAWLSGRCARRPS